VAREAGLAGRVNTVLQTCFFAISGVLPQEQAIAEIKHAITKSYARRGPQVIAQNEAAVDAAVAALHRVELPTTVTATRGVRPMVPADAPEFVRNVTGAMMAGHGEDLPVSALPVDGTYPSGTAAYEKRNISDEVAVWDPGLCIQCGNCSFVCPHSVIRSKLYDSAQLAGAPDEYMSMPLNSRGLPDSRFTLMVYLEDCTGCGLCVEACRSPPRPTLSTGDQPCGARAAGGRRAAQHRVLREPPPRRPLPRRLRHGAGHAVSAAALRVLRSLRRLWRDPVPEADLAALWRPPDDRQRHRLLLHLRWQPAHHAVDQRRRRARSGLVQLAVRGQRRIRPRIPARRRPAAPGGPRAAR